MKKLFTTLAVAAIALFSTNAASAFELSLAEGFSGPLAGGTFTPEQISGESWGLVGAEGTVSFTDPTLTTATVFSPSYETTPVPVGTFDWGTLLLMGKIDWTTMEGGQYTVVVPEGLLTASNGTNDLFSFTFTLDNAGGGSGDVTGYTVNPASGSTLVNLKKFQISFDSFCPGWIEDYEKITVTKDGTPFCEVTTDSDYFSTLTVQFATPATEAGHYVITIPANTIPDGENWESTDFYPEEIVVEYTLTGGEFEVTKYPLTASISGIDLASCPELTYADLEENMIINGLPQESFETMGNVTVLGPNGEEYSVAVNSYMISYTGSIIVYTGTIYEVLDWTTMPAGKYTLNLPAGYAYNDDGQSEAASFSFIYKGYEGGSGSDEPAGDVSVAALYFTVDGTEINMLANHAPFGQLTNGNFSWAVELEGGDDVKKVALALYQGEEWLGSWETETQDSFGLWTKTPWIYTMDFYDNLTYRVEVTAYNGTNGGNTTKTYGPFEVCTFTGTTPGFSYSDVTLEDIQPAPGTEITNVNEKFVLTFSGPIAEVKFNLNEGGQGGETVTLTGKPNGSKTVWTFDASEVWARTDHAWYTEIQAYDPDGLIVKGNYLENEATYFEFEYSCFLAGPSAAVTPAAGPVLDKLYTFVVTQGKDAQEDASIGKGISWAWTGFPTLQDTEGNIIAYANTNDDEYQYIYYDEAGNETYDGGFDREPDAIRFHLTKEVTEPGTYKLVIPHATFNFGSEQSSAFNRFQEVTYNLVSSSEVIGGLETVKVSVATASYASTSFDVVKSKSVTVNFTPAEGFALASLTLDGEDVTADVADNAYTFTPEADAALVATYEFTEDVTIIESSGYLDVESRQITVSNHAEGIQIIGLIEGDDVKVYSVNGMVLANFKATTDMVNISVPTGLYIVTVNGNAVKVQH